jgi:Cu/Ag efflux protein CusF
MFYIAGIAFGSWTGVALAQQPQMDQPPSEKAAQPEKMVGQLMHLTATVQKVDMKKRELTLKDDARNTMMVQVPEDVTRLENVKKGDRLNLDYYESAALSLKKPGESTGPAEAKIVERKEGSLPGGLVARKISASAEIVKIDPTENKVTIKGPNGELDTINVKDPDVQADLQRLKKGDQIQVTYSQALAASITPKEK